MKIDEECEEDSDAKDVVLTLVLPGKTEQELQTSTYSQLICVNEQNPAPALYSIKEIYAEVIFFLYFSLFFIFFFRIKFKIEFQLKTKIDFPGNCSCNAISFIRQ